MHVAVCDVLIEAGVAVTPILVTLMGAVVEDVTMDALPDCVLSWVEVATQVPVPVPDGVKTPDCVIVPPVAVHVTAVL